MCRLPRRRVDIGAIHRVPRAAGGPRRVVEAEAAQPVLEVDPEGGRADPGTDRLAWPGRWRGTSTPSSSASAATTTYPKTASSTSKPEAETTPVSVPRR